MHTLSRRAVIWIASSKEHDAEKLSSHDSSHMAGHHVEEISLFVGGNASMQGNMQFERRIPTSLQVSMFAMASVAL